MSPRPSLSMLALEKLRPAWVGVDVTGNIFDSAPILHGLTKRLAEPDRLDRNGAVIGF